MYYSDRSKAIAEQAEEHEFNGVERKQLAAGTR